MPSPHITFDQPPKWGMPTGAFPSVSVSLTRQCAFRGVLVHTAPSVCVCVCCVRRVSATVGGFTKHEQCFPSSHVLTRVICSMRPRVLQRCAGVAPCFRVSTSTPNSPPPPLRTSPTTSHKLNDKRRGVAPASGLHSYLSPTIHCTRRQCGPSRRRLLAPSLLGQRRFFSLITGRRSAGHACGACGARGGGRAGGGGVWGTWQVGSSELLALARMQDARRALRRAEGVGRGQALRTGGAGNQRTGWKRTRATDRWMGEA